MKLKKVIGCASVAALSLAGCQSMEDYRKERVEKADAAFKKLQDRKFPEDKMFTLPYAIQMALKHNLDLRVYDLKSAVNAEQKTAAALGMLPDLIVTDDITKRFNEPGASSQNLSTGQQSLAPSKSTEEFENRVRVELLFSALDFGLAYCKAVQQTDQEFITTEEKRRAAQNLILDVTRAYFRVAAAQYAMENTEKMIEISNETEVMLKQLEEQKKVPMLKVIDEQKRFLALKKNLMEYRRDYQNACVELKSLMGYYPDSNIVVDTSAMSKMAELKVPNVELLEEIALYQRPELFQLDLQRHITVVEARKTIIMMFPNVRAYVDFTDSTNVFLYNKSWWEVGMRAAYNLLKLPQQLEQYMALDSQVDQIDGQTLALSVGIISQVRIAHSNFLEVQHRFAMSEELYNVYKKHEIIAEKQASAQKGSISKVELGRIKMEAAQRAIERADALGNYYLAYFRLLNSVGVEALDKDTIDSVKARVGENLKDEILYVSEKIAGFETHAAEINAEIGIVEEELLSLNEQKEELEQKLLALSESKNGAGAKLEATHAEVDQNHVSKLKETEDLIAIEQANLENLKKRLANLDVELGLEKLVSKKTDLEKQMGEKESSLEQEKESLERVNRRLADYNDAHENKIPEMLQNDIKMLNEKITMLTKQQKDIISEFNTVSNAVVKAQDNKEALEYAIKNSIENAEDKIAELTDAKESIHDEYADAKYDTDKEHKKALASVEDELVDSSSYLAAVNEEIAEKTKNKELLLTDKSKLEDAIKSAMDEQKEINASISKYDGAIAMLLNTSAQDNIVPNSNTLASDPEVLENLEMLQNTQGNTITPEEYNSDAYKSINFEAQQDAGDKDLYPEEYNPLRMENIGVETQRDAGNNSLYGEDYNRQRLKTENAQDNAIDRQMGRSTEQPGRSGN